MTPFEKAKSQVDWIAEISAKQYNCTVKNNEIEILFFLGGSQVAGFSIEAFCHAYVNGYIESFGRGVEGCIVEGISKLRRETNN